MSSSLGFCCGVNEPHYSYLDPNSPQPFGQQPPNGQPQVGWTPFYNAEQQRVAMIGTVYYKNSEQPFFHIGDIPSVSWHSKLLHFLPSPGHPEPHGPEISQMLVSGIVPPGWGQKAQGIKTIAVVGAGPSGLISAKLLKAEGFEVTVFEASEKVGGQSQTYMSKEGKPHDLATKWVPAYSVFGDGAPSIQKRVIDDLEQTVGLKLVRSGGNDFYDTLRREEMKVPSMLQSCSKIKVASDFVAGVSILEKLAYCPGVNGVVDCGIANPNENLKDWSERTGLQCFGALVAVSSDAIGAGPALEMHVGYSLKARSYFLLAQVVNAIVENGVLEQPEFLLPPRGPLLKKLAANRQLQTQILNTQFVDVFEKGYDEFWRAFVQRYALDVRLSDPVKSVTPGSPKVKVVSAEGEKEFDHVVVASPPRTHHEFLSGHYAPTWTHVKASSTEVCAFSAYKSLNENLWLLDLEEPNVGLHPGMCEAGVASPGGINYEDSKVIAINNEWNDGVFTTLDYPRKMDQNTGADCGIVGRQLTALGFELENEEAVARKWSVWPSYVEGAAFGDFIDYMRGIQGKNGLSFVGEELAGGNVPAIFDWTSAFFVSGAWLGEGTLA